MIKDEKTEIKVVSFHLKPSNNSRLLGFADVQLDGLIIRDFRLLKNWDGIEIVYPRVTWRGLDEKIKYKTIITLPKDIEKQVFDCILGKYREVTESEGRV